MTVNDHIKFVYCLKTMLLYFANYKLEILQSQWKKKFTRTQKGVESTHVPAEG